VGRPWLDPRRRSFVWLGGVLVGCVAGFTVVYWFTVQTITGRQLADTAIRGASLAESQLASAVNAVLDLVTVTVLIAAVAGIAVVALIRMRRTSGLVAIGLLVAANVSARILKSYVLPRSDLGLTESTPATVNSLPGGHTTAAFSIGVAVLFVVPPAVRSVTAAMGIVFTSTVAIATMSAGWHRVGDSLASFFLVTAWAALAGMAVLIAESGFTPADQNRMQRRRPGRWWAATAVGLILIAAAIIPILAVDPRLRESALGPPAAFGAGALLIVGTAAALTVVVLRIVARVSDTSTEPTPPGPAPEDAGEASPTPRD
jgi:hypothetical protein